MSLHREYVTEADSDAAVATSTASGALWSPAQFVGLIVGIGFTVLGIAALARTGFSTAHVYVPHRSVWHLPHSPLLALIEIGYGVLMILVSVVPGGARALMAMLGAAALVLGLVILTGPPHRVVNWLAVNHRSGWLFTIAGAVTVIAAVASPSFSSRRPRRTIRRVDAEA